MEAAGPDAGRTVNGDSEAAATMSAKAQEQTSSEELGPPAGLENTGNCCFANAMIQAFHSVQEIRDHLRSKRKAVDNQSERSTNEIGCT